MYCHISSMNGLVTGKTSGVSITNWTCLVVAQVKTLNISCVYLSNSDEKFSQFVSYFKIKCHKVSVAVKTKISLNI